MKGTPAQQASQGAPSRLSDRGAAVRVTEVVRTDSQSQTLDSFLERPAGAGNTASPAAAASFMAVPRKRKAAEQAFFSHGVAGNTPEEERASAAVNEFPVSPPAFPRTASDAVAALKSEVECRIDQGTRSCVIVVCAFGMHLVCPY